jgi:cation diffusion facilitator family transporter
VAVSSKKAVYAALFGNLGIAISKFVAAIMTGSVSMWAEAYHSSSDTVNQILLLLGIKVSTKKATYAHQFGFGKSQYFWSFIVATMIFGISGVLALEQGISSLTSKGHSVEDPTINYIILAIAAVFEGNALRVALNVFKTGIKEQGKKINFESLITEFKESKDPTILTVIVEDSAALAGILVAAIGIFLTDVTGNVVYDAIASIIIGMILMLFAFFLAKENQALLLGESITTKQYKKIVKAVKGIPEVNKVITLRTMHLSPNDVLVGIQVNLVDGLETDQIETVTDKVEVKIMEVLPNANRNHIFVEIER